VKEGRLQPGRGSLAEVLPATLIAQLIDAPHDSIEWHASSGQVHRLRVCGAATNSPSTEDLSGIPPHASGADRDASGADLFGPRLTDFGPLIAHSTVRQPLAAAVADAGEQPAREDGPASTRLIGTLVHRLLQRLGFAADETTAKAAVRGLLHPEETFDADATVIDAAAAAYAAIASRADVRELYAAGRALHEVPFTMRLDGAWLRGTIDCVICRPDGGVTVLEFKTGRPRPEHARQVELYRQAAARLFQDANAGTYLVYSGEAAAT
jgi:hypothetical protein